MTFDITFNYHVGQGWMSWKPSNYL